MKKLAKIIKTAQRAKVAAELMSLGYFDLAKNLMNKMDKD
jgi:hypothetical protein